jgi:hypothetical protein
VHYTRPVILPFSREMYSVHPRAGLLGLMFRSYTVHDIRSVPRGEHYAFSQQTGELRREADAMVIAHVNETERTSLLGPRARSVSDPATGVVLGALVPRGRDWEIKSAGGDVLTVVQFMRASSAFGSFVARMDDEEVCRFTWGTQGWTAFSAELLVEFHPTLKTRIDRRLLMVLAPLLERQARGYGDRADS